MGGAVASGGVALTTTGAAAYGATPAARPGRVPKDLRPGGTLDRLVADLASKDRFSGSLLLTRRGRTVLSRSHGMADKQAGDHNGPDTRFVLASVTKMFTATAIHQLVQRNKLGYHDTLGTHLDGFPARTADSVTIHHLLTHSSGLGDYHSLPGYAEESMTWDSPEAMLNGTVRYIRRADLAFTPGAGHLYSNAAFCLLGAIVAAVSGRSYYDYVTEYVFEAAGMRDSAFHTKPQWRTDPRIAHPYSRKRGESERTDRLEEFPYIGRPDGDAIATCADMERFAYGLLDGRLLDPAYTELMLGAKIPMPRQRSSPDSPAPSEPPPSASRPSTFVGYGAVTSLAHGQWVHGHGGGTTLGASASIDIVPGSGWVVVVLSNYGGTTVKPIAQLARQLILQQ